MSDAVMTDQPVIEQSFALKWAGWGPIALD